MAKKTTYPEPKRAKVGRSWFVCDHDGNPLVGLSWDKGNGQYYYTYFKNDKDFKTGKKTRKDYSFGVHYEDAVFKFKQWIRDNDQISLTLPTVETRQEIIRTYTDTEKENLVKMYQDLGATEEEIEDWINAPFFGDGYGGLKGFNVKNIIQTDKKYALQIIKQLLRDEELRIETTRFLKLDDLLPKDYGIVRIISISDYYFENSDSKNEEKGKVKRAVEYFISVVKKKNLNDITAEDLRYYKDYVNNTDYSDSIKVAFLDKFKTALNFFLENNTKLNGEKELVRSVLGLAREVLKTSTAKPDSKAQSISKAIMGEIFKACKNDEELTLMFLLMLNTGYTAVDIRQLKKEDIREIDGIKYITYRRTKTDNLYVRVNCIWDITYKLLTKQMIKTANSEYIFTSKAGGAYAEATLGRKFTNFFKPFNKKHKTNISAKLFKDTVASSIAFKVQNTNIVKLTLGHSTKDGRDIFWRYIEEHPEEQKPAIDVLYNRFKDVIDSI